MRFMIVVKATPASEAGVVPELVAAVGKYHEELARAGLLIEGAGLHPSSTGWRVKYSGGERTVVVGPFTETRELVAAYTLIRAKGREEALEWTKRFPDCFGGDGEIEVRQLLELEDLEQTEAIRATRTLGAATKTTA